MSLVAAFLVGAGAAIAASALVRRRRRARDETHAAPEPELPGFPVAVGDVITVASEEAWLEKGWLLEEAGTAVAAVLFARKVVVLAEPAPRSALYWLSAVSAPALSGEPPPSLDVEGEHFDRARRIPVAIRVLDRAPDPPWETALLAEYRALGGRVLWLLCRGARALAWRGRRVEDDELDNLGSGS